jgi:hypothetical protein
MSSLSCPARLNRILSLLTASRATVPTGYGYVLPDEKGWSLYLHFESALVAVMTGVLYVAFGFWKGHFRRNLLPARFDPSLSGLASAISRHLRLRRQSEEEAWSYYERHHFSSPLPGVLLGQRECRRLRPSALAPAHGPDRNTVAGDDSPGIHQRFTSYSGISQQFSRDATGKR